MPKYLLLFAVVGLLAPTFASAAVTDLPVKDAHRPAREVAWKLTVLHGGDVDKRERVKLRECKAVKGNKARVNCRVSNIKTVRIDTPTTYETRTLECSWRVRVRRYVGDDGSLRTKAGPPQNIGCGPRTSA